LVSSGSVVCALDREEGYATREEVHYVKAWPEFWVQSVDGWVNLVEAMFDVLNGALKS